MTQRLSTILASRSRRIACIVGFVLAVVIRPAGAQQLAVLSKAEDVLVFIDLKTGEELQRIDVGRMCHELAVDSTGRYAYTGSYRGNTVHAIDLEARTAREFAIDGFQRFHGVELSPKGDVLFVTSEDSSAVFEVDTGSGSVLRAWPAPGLRAHMVALTSDGRKLYVGSEKPGAAMVINRGTGETKMLETGRFTVDVEISPDSTEVWVAARDEGKIAIIDIETDQIISTFDPGGNSPAMLRFHPNRNEVWVTHFKGNTVTVVDRDSHRVTGTVDVGGHPLGLTFSPDGGRVYVSRPRANEVVEIDASTRTILRRFQTVEKPDSMIWLP